MTFEEFSRAARALAFPAGESPYTVDAHQQSIAEALSDLQTWVPCLRQVNVELVPHCATVYRCGTTAFQAPLGRVLEVGVVSERAREISEHATPWATGLFLQRSSYAAPQNEPRGRMPLTRIHTVTWEYLLGIRIRLSAILPGGYPMTPGEVAVKGRLWWKDPDAIKNIYRFPPSGEMINRADWAATAHINGSAKLEFVLPVSPQSAVFAEVTEVSTTSALAPTTYALEFDIYGPPYSRETALLTADTEWCGYIKYRYLEPAVFKRWYDEVAQNIHAKDNRVLRGLSSQLPGLFCRRLHLPSWLSGRINQLPTAVGGQLVFGYVKSTAVPDNQRGRALAGVWTVLNGMIHIAPWIQSYEHVVVQWTGIKKVWRNNDVVPNDPLVLRAASAALARDHARFYDKNYDYAALQDNDYKDARTLLYVNCVQKSRPAPEEARGDAMATVQSVFGLPLTRPVIPAIPDAPPPPPPGGGDDDDQEFFGNDELRMTFGCADIQKYGDQTVEVIIEANRFTARTKALANQMAAEAARLEAASKLTGCQEVQGFVNTVRAEASAQCWAGSGVHLISGATKTAVVEPGAVVSQVSEDDANQLAQQLALDRAKAQLECVYGNAPITRQAECPTDPNIKVTVSVARGEVTTQILGAPASQPAAVQQATQLLNQAAESIGVDRASEALNQAGCPPTATVCMRWTGQKTILLSHQTQCWQKTGLPAGFCQHVPCTIQADGHSVIEVCLEVGAGSEYEFHDVASARAALSSQAQQQYWSAVAQAAAEGAAIQAQNELLSSNPCSGRIFVPTCAMCGPGQHVYRSAFRAERYTGKRLNQMQKVS